MSDTTEAIDLANASDDDLKAMGLPPAFTLDQMKSWMTEEEIERELNSDDPLITRPEGEGDDDDDDDEDDEEDGDDGADGTGAGDDDTAQASVQDVPDPVYQPTDVTAHKAIVNGAGAERRAIREKYNDGELTDAEYDAQLDAVADRLADAKAAIKDAERADAAGMKAWQDAWYDRAAEVQKANPAFNDKTPTVAYQGDKYSVYQIFDQACQQVNSNPQLSGLSHKERAEAAAEMTRAFIKQQTGQDLAAPAAKPGKKAAAAPAEKTPAEKVKEAGKRPAPVQTLGGLTAASETEVTGGKFAGVDTAKGMEAERMIAAMSDAEREAYLQGA